MICEVSAPGLVALRLSGDGTMLVGGHRDGNVSLWVWSGGRLTPLQHFPSGLRSLQEVALWEGTLVAVGEGNPSLWKLPQGERIAGLTLPGRTHCAAFSPDGAFLLTAGSDEQLRCWSTRTFHEVARESVGERNASIFFRTPTEFAVTCSWQGGSRVRYFQLQGDRLGSGPRPAVAREADSLRPGAFSPDGRLLGFSDDYLNLYQVESGRRVQSLDPSGVPLQDPEDTGGNVSRFWSPVAFVGGRCWAASPEGNLFGLEPDGRVVAGDPAHPGPVPALAGSPDGTLFTAGLEGQLRAWRT